MIGTGDYQARWAAPGAEPATGQTPQSSYFVAKYASPGTYEAIAVSETGGFAGRCQIQVFGGDRAMIKLVARRTDDGVEVVQD